jgi:hypothetical protein
MNVEMIQEAKLKEIVREAVRDAIAEEFGKLRLAIAPYISDEEQREIEEIYTKPSKKAVRTLLLSE